MAPAPKMNSCHNTIIPSCRLWILLSHRAFGIFWLNIFPAKPIYISHNSDSVSW